MATVETASGPIDVGQLGRTLMHEHVFVLTPDLEQNYDLGWDEEARIADAIERLDELGAAGIGTIVDLTVVGLGRYMPRIARIAAATDLRIVVATGLYTYNEVPHYFDLKSVDDMAAMFVGDITEGIVGTGIKAAILKCATDKPGLTPGVENVLRAVARAHRQTGVPISTHTDATTERGLEQQRIFAEEGVDLGRVVIGHSGDSTDLVYLEKLMDAGSYIGMDRFGVDVYLPFEQRVEVVAELCRRGRADRMVLSHDASCHIDWFPREQVRTVLPRWHFLHISQDVLPALRAKGVTEDQIDQMLVANPRAIFSASGGY
jgi:phosphotriesterase-related protein